MKFEKCDDVKILQDICKESGSKRVKQSASYLGVAKYRCGEKFYAELIGDYGFYAGTYAKKHFNLLDMAVKEQMHGKGIGSALAKRMKENCIERNIRLIRLRTSINETAVDFWQKQGAKIVGMKEDDFVMEIEL